MRTGYEAVIRKKFADPMPDYLSFDTDTLEKMAGLPASTIPWDERRYFSRRRQPDRRRRRRVHAEQPRLDRDREEHCTRTSPSTAASARGTSSCGASSGRRT